jgi:small subunit ribosomal protein S3
MAIERRFIEENVKNARIEEYLMTALSRAGYGGMDIKRSPLGTRIVVTVERPGRVVGRKGRSIKGFTAALEKDFALDNIQIEVEEIVKPELNAYIMATHMAEQLERGINFRRAAYGTLRRIMEGGAKGAEIHISGKLTGERAKSMRFYDGYLKKAGNAALEHVSVGYIQAKLKLGVLGIVVRIMPPNIAMPDEIRLKTAPAQIEESGEPLQEHEIQKEEKPASEETNPEEMKTETQVGEESGDNSKQ